MTKKSLVSTNWKTLSKKSLVQNKYVNLWHDRILLPNGKESDYFVFRRSPFSVVIPMESGEIYIVRQYRYAVGQISVEFPMGSVEGKIAPEEIATRELKEEVGATAKELKQIGKFWVSTGKSDQVGYVFIAENLTFGEQELEDAEFIEFEKMPIEKVTDMIENGEILDGPTITSFHFLKSYLEKNMKTEENQVK